MFVRWGFCRRHRRHVGSLFIVLSCCLSSVPLTRAAATETKWTSYLRAGPGLQYAALDEIPPHRPLTVRDCASGWCRVLAGRAEGYVQQGLLTEAHPEPITPGTQHDCFEATMTGWVGGSHVRFCGK